MIVDNCKKYVLQQPCVIIRRYEQRCLSVEEENLKKCNKNNDNYYIINTIIMVTQKILIVI